MLWLLFGFGAAALMTGALIFLIAISRETGRLEERVKKLHEEADRAEKQAQIMAESREPEDAIDRLDRGTF